MKKQLILIAFASIGFCSFASGPNKGGKNIETLKVNATESTVKWHATKVTGEHNGSINLQSGEVSVEGNNLTGANVIIDMSSIMDADMQGEYKGKLEGHLKSDDFFAVEKFKTANLKVKSLSLIKGAKAGSDNYTVIADLTIKGITKEVTFPAMVVIAKDKVIANVSLDINRANYDIRYGSKSFFEGLGDKAIDDTFNIKVRLVAQR